MTFPDLPVWIISSAFHGRRLTILHLQDGKITVVIAYPWVAFNSPPLVRHRDDQKRPRFPFSFTNPCFPPRAATFKAQDTSAEAFARLKATASGTRRSPQTQAARTRDGLSPFSSI